MSDQDEATLDADLLRRIEALRRPPEPACLELWRAGRKRRARLRHALQAPLVIVVSDLRGEPGK